MNTITSTVHLPVGSEGRMSLWRWLNARTVVASFLAWIIQDSMKRLV